VRKIASWVSALTMLDCEKSQFSNVARRMTASSRTAPTNEESPKIVRVRFADLSDAPLKFARLI
jgi:hypothetical protein